MLPPSGEVSLLLRCLLRLCAIVMPCCCPCWSSCCYVWTTGHPWSKDLSPRVFQWKIIVHVARIWNYRNQVTTCQSLFELDFIVVEREVSLLFPHDLHPTPCRSSYSTAPPTDVLRQTGGPHSGCRRCYLPIGPLGDWVVFGVDVQVSICSAVCAEAAKVCLFLCVFYCPNFLMYKIK